MRGIDLLGIQRQRGWCRRWWFDLLSSHRHWWFDLLGIQRHLWFDLLGIQRHLWFDLLGIQRHWWFDLLGIQRHWWFDLLGIQRQIRRFDLVATGGSDVMTMTTMMTTTTPAVAPTVSRWSGNRRWRMLWM